MRRAKPLLLVFIMVLSVAAGGVAATPSDNSPSHPPLPEWLTPHKSPTTTTTTSPFGNTLLGQRTGTSNSDTDLMQVTSAAEPPEERWSKQFGDDYKDELVGAVETTADGGYVMLGFSNFESSNYWQASIAKISNNGTFVWETQLPNLSARRYFLQMGERITQTDDGAFIVGVNTYDSESGEFYATIFKISQNGEIVWRKQPARGHQSVLTSVGISQGDIVATGAYRSGPQSNVWVTRLDASGDVLLNKEIDVGESGMGIDLAPTSNGLTIVGQYHTSDNYNTKVWVGSVSMTGEVSAERHFDFNQSEVPTDIDVTEDGGYVINIRASYDAAQTTLLKLHSDFSVEWKESQLLNSGYNHLSEVEQTDDGGYALLGYIYVNETADTAILRTNERGERLWLQQYAVPEPDGAFDAEYLGSDGYIMAGTIVENYNGSDNTYGNYDGYVVKVGNGESGTGSSPSGVGIAVTPPYQVVNTGKTVPMKVRANNLSNGVGAYEIYINITNASVASISDYKVNVKGADATTSASLSTDHSSLHVSTALASAEAQNLTLVTPEITTQREGQATIRVNVKAIGDLDGNAYDIATVRNSTLTVEEGLAVSIEPNSQNTNVGSATSTSIVVHNVSGGGIGAYSFTYTVANSSVATIENVMLMGNPASTSIDIAPDNRSVTVQAAQADTSNSGDIVIANISLTGQSQGQTPLDLSITALGSEAGNSYDVGVVQDGSLTVSATAPPPVAGDQRPNDLDEDGVYEDVNGDGNVNAVDVQALFKNLNSKSVQNHTKAFDINGDGSVDVVDVQKLFNQVT